MSFIQKNRFKIGAAIMGLLIIYLGSGIFFKESTEATHLTLLNVSYDPTRELYKQYNEYFVSEWKKKTGQTLRINQSHGGSGKQARSVIDGLQADVVTLALAYDIDGIADKTGLIAQNWQSRLPDHSSPYTSTIVFLVRKGNPKKIKDWANLVKPGVEVITPNPKTSGGARWNFLAAWAYGITTFGTEEKAKEFVTQLFQQVSVLDSGARGSTTTFVKRGIGDVLMAWENEALLIVKELAPNEFEIVYPSISILAEPSIAWVDEVTQKRGTTNIAKAYLMGLYDPHAQELAANHYYRPRNQDVLKRHKNQFPDLELVTIANSFGDWHTVQTRFFSDGGLFDDIYQPKK